MTTSILHYEILKYIIEYGYAPGVHELSLIMNMAEGMITAGLHQLLNEHGLVLHPESNKIWVIHPFSMAPTNFLAAAGGLEWWGNCAWCSLGIAAILKKDLTITTSTGADSNQIKIHIVNGNVTENNLFIHFPVPMHNAWDNVIYTCSTIQVFEDPQFVNTWCKKHGIQRGDIQPIDKIWELAKMWYGDYLNPGWKKWSVSEAGKIFFGLGLTGNTWQLSPSEQRF